MIQVYCKFQLTQDLKEITFSTQNSWKGLIMAFLSITYSKYRYDFTEKIDYNNQYVLTQVSYKYEKLISVLDHTNLDDTDDRIEQIAAPPSWRPCYVTANRGYPTRSIERSLTNFAKILNLDTKSSTISTQYANTLPHEYKCRPAKKEELSQDFSGKYSSLYQKLTYMDEIRYYLPKQKIQLLWQCRKEWVEGVVIINNDTMKSLYGDRLLVVANELSEILHFPEIVEMCDDHGHPAPFLGCAITSDTEKYLYQKFPYLRAELCYQLYKSPDTSYVIFDKKYMGKWG